MWLVSERGRWSEVRRGAGLHIAMGVCLGGVSLCATSPRRWTLTGRMDARALAMRMQLLDWTAVPTSLAELATAARAVCLIVHDCWRSPELAQFLLRRAQA